MPSILDISTPDFPGTSLVNGQYAGLRPTPEFHPHLRLDECLVSVPKVNPGDTVFWHADVIHSVEEEHTGSGDSAGKHNFVLARLEPDELYCNNFQ
jgi:Protein of unknown function (DUF1479)